MSRSVGRAFGTVLRAIALVVCAGACSGVLDSPEPASTLQTTSEAQPSSDGLRLKSERDGYSLAVRVDRTVVRPGDTVTFESTFKNATDQPIDYSAAPCGGAATAFVQVAVPNGPYGRKWPGIAGEFKDYALTRGEGPGGVGSLDPVQVDLRQNGCTEPPTEAILAPGASVTSSLTWKAEFVNGVNAAPGSVPFTVHAGYDRQNGPPSYPPDYKGPRGSWIPMYKELIVNGSIDVRGPNPEVISPGQAIDALLANRAFSRWLSEDEKSTWSNANLFLESQRTAEGIIPKGVSWDIELFKERGVPRHWAIAFIDAINGSVRSVTYCNVPCDR